MSWLDTTLGHRMRHQEEVEFTIYNFRLLYEALINISALRRVINKCLTILISLLEESLTNSLVHYDESNLWWVILSFFTGIETIFLLDNLIKLFKF